MRPHSPADRSPDGREGGGGSRGATFGAGRERGAFSAASLPRPTPAARQSSRERLAAKFDSDAARRSRTNYRSDGDGWGDGADGGSVADGSVGRGEGADGALTRGFSDDDARASQDCRRRGAYSHHGEEGSGEDASMGGAREDAYGAENASEGELSAREQQCYPEDNSERSDGRDDGLPDEEWMRSLGLHEEQQEDEEWMKEQDQMYNERDAEGWEKENRMRNVSRIVTSRKDPRGRCDEQSRSGDERSFCENDSYRSDLHERQQNEFGLTGRRGVREEGSPRSALSERYGNESYYSYDCEGRIQEHSGRGQTEWALDRVDYEQIRRPQSMPFEDDHDDVYDGDDEYQYAEPEEPPKEIVIQEREVDGYHESQLTSYDETGNDSQHYNEDDNSAMEEEAPRHTARTAAEPIFHTSDSLEVIHRIESVMEGIFQMLDRKEEPILRGYVCPEMPFDDENSLGSDAVDALANLAKSNGDPKLHRSFGNIAQCRSFASLCMVMSLVHGLLLSNRTTTTREVYYVFVTHFRNQKECDGAILDVAKLLGVSRRSLGLSASPKGWFCGCVQITRRGTLPSGKDVSGSIDGTALSSIQGLPITREWTERDEAGCTDDGVEIKVSSKDAKVILVIEKEGVYNRLSEERIFDRFPCILVTGKGFPDLATRALVSTLHRELDLPVVGLCDCNPYGISVLALYHCAGDRMGVDGKRRYSVPIKWLGLRPSEVAKLKGEMPETVFQKLTDLDKKRIASLLDQEDSFLSEQDEEEVRGMEDAGYKCELEALYWLSPSFLGNYVERLLKEALEKHSPLVE